MEVGYVKCRPSVEKSLDVANTSVRATRAINSSATMPLSWIGRAMHARGWHHARSPPGPIAPAKINWSTLQKV